MKGKNNKKRKCEMCQLNLKNSQPKEHFQKTENIKISTILWYQLILATKYA